MQIMKYKYLNSIPKPLLNDFLCDRVVPFVGSGFSKNADISDDISVPDWNELGKSVASEIDDYKYENNAIDTFSYYEYLFSRTKLIELLKGKLHADTIYPGKTHEAFCKIFKNVICTTNFDFLIENQMTKLQRPKAVIATEDGLAINNNNACRIIKLHGDFNNPDKMVITENDYDGYVKNNPIFCTYIANLFITNTMLLVGYSLDDSDFRSIWRMITNRLGKMSQPAYCVTVGASKEKISRYERRNIKVINLSGKPSNYKTILEDFFNEINDYISKERNKSATSRNERINDQLIIPPEDNKLCFISCSNKRIAQLSKILYPILYGIGVTPLRLDDIIKPGENWVSVAETAIRKSNAIIVDLSDNSEFVYSELSFALSNAKDVMIICEEGKQQSFIIKDKQVIVYSFDDLSDEFEENVRDWLCNVLEINNEYELLSNADRLLKKGEYSACIISAFSDLDELYYKVCSSNHSNLDDTISLVRPLRSYLIRNSGFSKPETNDLFNLRNQIAHSSYKANKKDALEVLSFAQKVLKIIKEKNS